MDAVSDIKILISNRKFIAGLVSKLSSEQLQKIPVNYKTNILWNIGHLVASQQILSYTLSGVKPHVSETFLTDFRKGSSPSAWIKKPDEAEVFKLFSDLPELLNQDYHNGVFDSFSPYKTSAGAILENIDDSLAYNNYHEGIHTGIIQCLLKLV